MYQFFQYFSDVPLFFHYQFFILILLFINIYCEFLNINWIVGIIWTKTNSSSSLPPSIHWNNQKRSASNTLFLTHYYWLKFIENYKSRRESLNELWDPSNLVIFNKFQQIIRVCVQESVLLAFLTIKMLIGKWREKQREGN